METQLTLPEAQRRFDVHTQNHVKLELCRQLGIRLDWSERNVERSARVLSSKALFLGLDKWEVEQLIMAIPSASYLHQRPDIFYAAWESISKTAAPDRCFTEFEWALAGVN